MTVEQTIKDCGGVRAVANQVEVTTTTVRNWIKADRLPKYAADKLGVEPRGTFKKAGRPAGKRSWWKRFVAWVMDV